MILKYKKYHRPISSNSNHQPHTETQTELPLTEINNGNPFIIRKDFTGLAVESEIKN